MQYFSQYTHVSLLKQELRKLITDGTFVSYVWSSLGFAIDQMYDETTDTDACPIELIHYWVIKDGGYDPEWLASDDGLYVDDNGVAIPDAVKPILSPSDQLVAYGLWLIESELNSCGEFDEWSESRSAIDEYGFTQSQIIEHRSACLLLAYQALFFSQKILDDASGNFVERPGFEKVNFSELGKAGAKKRHQKMSDLKVWTVDKWKRGNWSSANAAAFEISDEVISYGRSIGAHLTPSNAQRTIAEWIRKSV